MFLGKLFKKDHHHFLKKGERLLGEERYADARAEFQEALALLGDGIEHAEERSLIKKKLAQIGNKLGELNLTEAEHSAKIGNIPKAIEHIKLVIELSENLMLREKAENLLNEVTNPNQNNNLILNNNCVSCGQLSCETVDTDSNSLNNLHFIDRFNLLVNQLPGDLPERYSSLGEKFAYCYTLINDGNDADALQIIEEMLSVADNDILYYELALIMYRFSKLEACETLLEKSIDVRVDNPLPYLALVQLKVGDGRLTEAVQLLQHMMGKDLLVDQASVMLGEVYFLAGNEEAAIENWSKALQYPSVARGAAERLIPLLSDRGLLEEAKFLSKKFVKGCC